MAKAVAQSSIVFEVLEKDNYVDWSEAIEAYLKAQDLWDVVISDQKPPKKEEDEAQFKEWEKTNAAALHAIKISCGKHFISKIRGIREANKAWRTLEANFNPPTLPRRVEYTINPQEGDEENVDDEYKKAYKSLVDALSRRDISDAIELCTDNPALLTERLPNFTPPLHELIMLASDCSEDDKVVEMLNLDQFPKEALEMRDSLGRTPLIAAVSCLALGIAKCLVEIYDTLLIQRDDSGLIPLAVAIDSLYTPMIEMLNSKTPPDFWTMEGGRYGATVITKCFQARKLDFAIKFIKDHQRLILAKDVNGISPLSAAAREPYMLSTGSYNHKFPKFISNFLRVCLPQHSKGENPRIELLIAMRNAIIDLKMTTGLLRDAFFEAIKCDNFNFLIMLINADIKVLEEVNDMSHNIYMCAVKYRRAKVFSLIFWYKKNWTHREQYINSLQDKWKNNLLHMAATWAPPNALDGISNPGVLMLREVTWFEEVWNMTWDLEKKVNVDGKTPHELFKESHKDLILKAEKGMKKSASSWSIVGPLVITIMFAAAFQIPGGYNQEMGFPIFLNKKLFKSYMVLVSISLFSATISVLKFLETLSSTYQGKDFLGSLKTYNVITGTLFLSIATMLVAFCLGLFLTLHGERAIFLPISVFATFLVGYIVCRKFPPLVELFPTYRWKSLFEKNISDEVDHIFKMLNEEVAT